MRFVTLLLLSLFTVPQVFAEIRVGVITTPNVTGVEFVDQLNDDTYFDFEAEGITVAQAEDLAFLESFDVVVLGDFVASTAITLEMAQALRDYHVGGGGVVTVGWFNYAFFNALDDERAALINEVTPIERQTYAYSSSGSSIEPGDSTHPVAEGVETFTTGGFCERARAIKDGAERVMLVDSNETYNGFVAHEKDYARSFYIGLVVHGRNGYEVTANRSGPADRLIEQAVAWTSASVVDESHICLQKGGAAKCFGRNHSGQLGLGDVENRGDEPGEMGEHLPAVSLGSGFEVIQVASGGERSCAVSRAGQVKCFGSNMEGILGYGDTMERGSTAGSMGDALPAVALGAGFKAIAVDLNLRHTCALSEAGQVKCWGSNEKGELGLEDQELRGDSAAEMGDALPAVDLGTGRTAKALSVGEEHTCVLLDNDSVKCWGFNGAMAIGAAAGQMGDNLMPVSLGSVAKPMKLSSGSNHICALFDNHQVKCWGENAYGQLGVGDTERRGLDPETMGENLPFVNFGSGQMAKDISCGGDSCCALFFQGTVKCWGRNRKGKLGYGDSKNVGGSFSTLGENLNFVEFGALTKVKGIKVTRKASCAATEAGWKCWGANKYGSLGQGDVSDRGSDFETLPKFVPIIAL